MNKYRKPSKIYRRYMREREKKKREKEKCVVGARRGMMVLRHVALQRESIALFAIRGKVPISISVGYLVVNGCALSRALKKKKVPRRSSYIWRCREIRKTFWHSFPFVYREKIWNSYRAFFFRARVHLRNYIYMFIHYSLSMCVCVWPQSKRRYQSQVYILSVSLVFTSTEYSTRYCCDFLYTIFFFAKICRIF